MLKTEYVAVFNIESALRGMRNAMESWEKSDSYVDFSLPEDDTTDRFKFIIGDKDKDLAQRLMAAGTDHRKFLRQIFVSMDIIAPLYWWKEMDTYKVGTTVNSTSTMHKLGSRLLLMSDFSFDEIGSLERNTIFELNLLISQWQQSKDRKVWKRVIQNLPDAFNQRRTWTANYEVLRNTYNSRCVHKLSEWADFCNMCEKLPESWMVTE